MNSIKHEPIEPKYIEKAGRMLQDENYQKKVNEVMAMMQGKRTANSKYIGSPVHRD